MEFLLNNDIVRLSPSTMLQTAYAEAAMDMTMDGLIKERDTIHAGSKAESNPNPIEERMLLSKSSGKLLADYLEVPELAVEVERAVWQVERALKAQQESKDQAEVEAATKREL